MAAYAISEVEAKDAAGFEAYRTIAAKAIAHQIHARFVRHVGELFFYLGFFVRGRRCHRRTTYSLANPQAKKSVAATPSSRLASKNGLT